jgi:arginyl-tRNA synthetase
MQALIHLLEQKFLKAVLSAFPNLPGEAVSIEITPSTQEKFGHYQFNSAMKLTKLLKIPPRSIAEQIIQRLETTQAERPFIEKLEIAGPGFINITLDKAFLGHSVHGILSDPHLGIEKPQKQQKIIIDFSAPNTAKEMHVGHLRSTIIGDCLARVFEFMGQDVLRLNHIGDWGTSFGMLIAYMKEQAPEVLSGQQTTDLTHLVTWYKAGKQKFDADPAFKKKSQLEVVALQKGDPLSLKAWKIICSISSQAYQEIYDLLDVKLLDRGESYYNPYLADVVAELESKGLVQVSDGAKCIYLEGFQNREGEPLPLMIQKSDGGYNYDTTDMAAIRHRIQEEKGDRLIYVTDAGQSTHFQMIFAAAEKAGYLDRAKVQVDHVPFGLVLGPDGKKFRTRSGDTERLMDLLLQAIEQAEAIIEKRSPDMPAEERNKLARALGIGAVKYADLSCHRTGDYVFSYDRMLKFDGNTSAYLLYSYVRVIGIKKKVGGEAAKAAENQPLQIEEPAEASLALHILRFNETLDVVARDLLPNRLTDYLYDLADKFNAFFRDCRVEGSAQQNSRLQLCEAVARTMKQGLDILGVPIVDKM